MVRKLHVVLVTGVAASGKQALATTIGKALFPKGSPTFQVVGMGDIITIGMERSDKLGRHMNEHRAVVLRGETFPDDSLLARVFQTYCEEEFARNHELVTLLVYGAPRRFGQLDAVRRMSDTFALINLHAEDDVAHELFCKSQLARGMSPTAATARFMLRHAVYRDSTLPTVHAANGSAVKIDATACPLYKARQALNHLARCPHSPIPGPIVNRGINELRREHSPVLQYIGRLAQSAHAN